MSAARVLARIEALGARIDVHGDRLRVVAPRGALGEQDLEALAAQKAELLGLLRNQDRRSRASRARCDRFLEGCSIPFAVFHSRALGRDFVIARDGAALEEISEADRRLPVLTFADCEMLAGLEAHDLAEILDVRAAFGPSAEILAVRPRVG